MTKLVHVTSYENAISIIKTGIYRPNRSVKGDFGLNCFAVGRRYAEGQPANYGARLILEWSGPEEEVEPEHKMKPNVLYHQIYWRAFIPVGPLRHLSVTDLQFDAEAEVTIKDYYIPWYCITNNSRMKRRAAASQELKEEANRMIRLSRELVFAGLEK